MWHSTEKMAEAIAEGLVAAGVPTRLMCMKANHHSAVMTELADCGALIVGSPTHNNGIMPAMADVLTYMKGLRPQNKLGAAFGSFGWSGESVKVLQEWLTAMGMEQPVPPVKCQFVPKHETFSQCYALGEALGAALTARCEKA